MAASGGDPVPVLKLDPSKYRIYGGPKFLPDGKHFIYRAVGVDAALSGIYFASLDGKENRHVLNIETRFTYDSGYLLYVLDRTLMAQAFNPERGQLIGEAHPVAHRVVSDFYRNGIFNTSDNGVLIYQAGDGGKEKGITWFERTGKELGTGEGGTYLGARHLRLSPAGEKLAFHAGNKGKGDIWVEELTRGVLMRLTNDPESSCTSPTWSPDGSRILFCLYSHKARPGIYQMKSNGAGSMELLLAAETSGQGILPTSWSPDGKFILYVIGNAANPNQEIWVLPLSDRKPRLFIQNAFDGQFSPDGRWVAYTSNESGQDEIYVVPFDATKVLSTAPGAAIDLVGKWPISAGGGTSARWRGDGKEIFYPRGDNQMMAVEVDGRGNTFEARKEQALFKMPVESRMYDVTPNGKRFVVVTQNLINQHTPLTLVVNWPALLGNKP